MYYRRKKGEKAKPKKVLKYKGQRMESKAEINFAIWMDTCGLEWLYEPVRFPWLPPVKKYTPDFIVTRYDGSQFYVEYKGYLRTEDKTKMIAIKKQHPEIDLRFVFTNANGFPQGAKPKKDGTKTTNCQWAEANNYLWAEKTIPEEWLNE